jgi:hypothetical protein
MTELELNALRYPIGEMPTPLITTDEERQNWIADIEKLPEQLRQAVQNLPNRYLDTVYRPEGWTVRQVVHHVADSHINAYIRLKNTLTEDNPTIKPYEEQLWAELPDSELPVEMSLQIIQNVHLRMVTILRGLVPINFERTFFHPGSKKTFNLGTLCAMYSWHGQHHLAHIENLVKREGW